MMDKPGFRVASLDLTLLDRPVWQLLFLRPLYRGRNRGPKSLGNGEAGIPETRTPDSQSHSPKRTQTTRPAPGTFYSLREPKCFI